jgi:hypothetical protein
VQTESVAVGLGREAVREHSSQVLSCDTNAVVAHDETDTPIIGIFHGPNGNADLPDRILAGSDGLSGVGD